MVYDKCKACQSRVESCLLPDSHRAQNKHVWCCDFLLGGKHGTRIRKQFKPGVTKKEVEKYEHITIADFERGTFIPQDKSKILLADVLDKYYTEHIQENSRHPNGSVRYYIKELKKLMGNIGIGSIKLSHLQEARSKFKEETGSSNANVNRCFSVLSTVFNRAVEWEYLPKNPAQFLRPLPTAETAPRFLTMDELAKLWVEFRKDQRVEDYANALAHSGIRPINIKEMSWSQINFQTWSWTYTTYKGRKPRTLTAPIDKELQPTIMRRFKETNGQGKVFDTRFSHQTVERMIKDSGVNEGKEERERFTIYGLKHCYISHLIMAGVDIATVSELTGVSIPTLKKHYLRLTQDHLRVAQAKANLTPKAGVELKIV